MAPWTGCSGLLLERVEELPDREIRGSSHLDGRATHRRVGDRELDVAGDVLGADEVDRVLAATEEDSASVLEQRLAEQHRPGLHERGAPDNRVSEAAGEQ